jgi:hypothetical protein
MAQIMRGLYNVKVMAPPAPDPRHGAQSVPAVRMLLAYNLESDRVEWALDCMAVPESGALAQHTVRGGSRPLTAAAIGEGLIELGNLLKAAG